MDNMPKMTSMELPDKQESDDKKNGCTATQENKFPYGLVLRLDEKQMKMLPITDGLDVGDKVILHAECSIVSKRLSEQKDNDEEKGMEIQIESMSIMPKINKKPEDMDFEEFKAMRKIGKR